MDQFLRRYNDYLTNQRFCCSKCGQVCEEVEDHSWVCLQRTDPEHGGFPIGMVRTTVLVQRVWISSAVTGIVVMTLGARNVKSNIARTVHNQHDAGIAPTMSAINVVK